MNRTSRKAAALAVAAVLTLGATAPAAVARPAGSHGKGGDHKVVRTHVKATKAVKATRATKAERRANALERALTRKADRKDAYLARLARLPKVQRLETESRDAVLANILADQAELEALATAAAADGADLRSLAGDLRSVRPEVYHQVVNQLRLANALVDDVAGTPEADILAGLIETLRGFDADTARVELRATQRVISQVAESLEADEPEVEEPEVDEPEVDEPEVEEPEVEEPEVDPTVPTEPTP